MDALQYIDVTAPYFNLTNITILPKSSISQYEGVGCNFVKEQPNGNQVTDFDGAELGRHLAILGSVAAARYNPVKAKHYYLALEATLKLTGILGRQGVMRGESHVTAENYKRRRVTSFMTAYTEKGEVYATLEVSYAILAEDRLLKVLRPMDPSRIYGATWKPSQPSPYTTPIMLRLLRFSSPTTATAVISLHDVAAMSGHFAPRPTAPIAVLASNALVMCGHVSPGKFLCEGLYVNCSRLAVAGEVMEVKVQPIVDGIQPAAPAGMTHRVTFTDEAGESIGRIDIRVKPVEAQAVAHL